MKTPDRGDIVWLQFDPQAGHEQAKRRPALVLSPAAYNAKTSLAIMVPITSQVKGYPFEVALPPTAKTQGVVLADQAKSLDWRARQALHIEKAGVAVLRETTQKLAALLGFDFSKNTN